MRVLCQKCSKEMDISSVLRHKCLPLPEPKPTPSAPKQRTLKKQIKPPRGRSKTFGGKVLRGLQKGERWIADYSESCTSCRRRIIFLEIEGGKQKAFDVDKTMCIVGVHTCGEPSGAGSQFAFSGGIVDSNRRRH